MKFSRNCAPLVVLDLNQTRTQSDQRFLCPLDLGNIFVRNHDECCLHALWTRYPQLKPAEPFRALAGIFHSELGPAPGDDFAQRFGGLRGVRRRAGATLTD